jgi:hypothetical protein
LAGSLDGEKKSERAHVILSGGAKLGFESSDVFLASFHSALC